MSHSLSDRLRRTDLRFCLFMVESRSNRDPYFTGHDTKTHVEREQSLVSTRIQSVTVRPFECL